MRKDIKVKSLYKSLQILECFSVDKPEWGITELSDHLGLYKSNVFNIVDTLVKTGYMERNDENDKYRLGLKILELANVISSNFGFRKMIVPYMQQLAEDTNETIYLAIPNETEAEVIYLDSARPIHQHSSRSMLGVKAPLYCTAIGKGMLAYLPQDVLEVVLSKPLTEFTDNTITDEETLRDELETIRMQGYAIDNMEHEFGIKCVAMPIRNRKEEVVAGLSVSGPSLRFDEQTIAHYSQKLKRVISEIEDKI